MAWLAACFLWFTLNLAAAYAAPTVVLDGPKSTEELVGHVEAAIDPDASWSAAEALEQPFAAVNAVAPSFGYIDARVWMRVRVVNATVDEDTWRIVFSDYFADELDVFLLRPETNGAAAPETLLSLDIDSTFSDRPVPFERMVAPMRLAPGEEATVLFRLRMPGLVTMEMDFETHDSFVELVTWSAAKSFVMYGMSLLMLLLAVISLVVTRARVFLAYAALTTSFILYVFDGDGFAFRTIYPDHPRLNLYLPTILAGFIGMASANYARVFLNTRKRHPGCGRWLWASLAVHAAITASVPFTDPSFARGLLILVIPLGGVLVAATAFVAWRARPRETRIFLVAWICAALVVIGQALRHFFGLDMSRDVQFDVFRTWIVLDALLMGAAILDRYDQTMRKGRAAARANLAHAERNLQLSDRLGELERDYARLDRMAAADGRRIENTVHDLRQPLAALRLNLQGLTRQGGGRAVDAGVNERRERDAERIEASFSYIEGLVAEQLAATQDAAARSRPTGPHDALHGAADGVHHGASSEAEPLSLDAILLAVHEMFEPDARAKGLDLRYVPTTAATSVPPLVLMRCVSNLVSNAVKYTPSGGVLFGVRRRGDRLHVEVHDTGPGLDRAQFRLAQRRAHRLDGDRGVQGQGLGLDIVAEQALRHAFDVRLIEGRKGGSGIVLDLPRKTEESEPDGAARRAAALEAAQ